MIPVGFWTGKFLTIHPYGLTDYLTNMFSVAALPRFFRRSAFYDSEAYVLDIGILYEAPASGEENLEPYASQDDKKPTCVTTTIQDVASTVNTTTTEKEVEEKVNSPDDNNTSGAHVAIKGPFAVAAAVLVVIVALV